MKNIAALILFLAVLAACAAIPPANRCSHDKEALLALDENAFDQDLSNGGGGWRKIGNVPGCELAAAELISAYRAKYPILELNSRLARRPNAGIGWPILPCYSTALER